MVYVMSDIHGMYDKFIKMINKIKLTKEDKLIIVGDVFDRGPDPLKLLDYVVTHDNIELIKGNHEQFCVEYLSGYNAKCWMENGGITTLEQITRNGQDFMVAVKNYINTLPIIKVIDKFIIVHAGLYLPDNHNNYLLKEILNMQDEEYNLWNRSWLDKPFIPYKDYTIIVGHTPTITINGDNKIIKQDGLIFIDCGAPYEIGQLGCLRLDDMKEFYV